MLVRFNRAAFVLLKSIAGFCLGGLLFRRLMSVCQRPARSARWRRWVMLWWRHYLWEGSCLGPQVAQQFRNCPACVWSLYWRLSMTLDLLNIPNLRSRTYRAMTSVNWMVRGTIWWTKKSWDVSHLGNSLATVAVQKQYWYSLSNS